MVVDQADRRSEVLVDQADCKSGFYPRGRPFRFKLVKLFHCN